MRKSGLQWVMGVMVCLLVFGYQTPFSFAADTRPQQTSPAPLANGEVKNPHGSYTSNTNQCAQCHLLHQGKAENLLRSSSKKDTCFLCHDGRGSKYDVKNGKVWDETNSQYVDSAAGGFNPREGFTSTHLLEEVNTPPGGSGSSSTLECTNCHNPHGTTNHRNLLTAVNGKSNIHIEAEIDIDPATNKEIITYKPGQKDANGIPTSGMSQFCGSCHNDYVYRNNEPGAIDKTEHRHPDGVMLRDSMFTLLPVEGVPSGAYPNPKTSVGLNGSIPAGTYFYIITSSNLKEVQNEGKPDEMKVYQESSQGYVKKVVIASDNSSVNLVWNSVANAAKYTIYRAGPISDETKLQREDFKLVYRLEGTNLKAAYTPNAGSIGGTLKYADSLGTLTSSIIPPSIDDSGTRGKVFCMTCHYAHGTKTTDTSTGKSSLKRMDNMGVCQDCHKK